MGSSGQSEQEVKISEALGKVAEEHGIESVTAVALAYVMSKTPNVSFVGLHKSRGRADIVTGLSDRRRPQSRAPEGQYSIAEDQIDPKAD